MTLFTVGSGSTGNCHLLMANDQTLILDAGMPIKKINKALDYNLEPVQGAVITHTHADHYRSVPDLKLMAIPVFAPYEEENPKRVFLGDFTVKSIPLRNNGKWLHTNGDGSECPVCGFLIHAEHKNILYMTDFMYCPFTFQKFQLQTIIIGCNYEDDTDIGNEVKNYHVRLGHASLSTVKELVKANSTESLRHIVLCHLSGTADATRMEAEIKSVVDVGVTVDIAEANKTIDLGDTPF